MLKIVYALGCLGILSMPLSSCQKDLVLIPQNVEGKSTSEVEAIVKESRNWYESLHDQSKSQSQGAPNSPAFIGDPHWGNVSFVKLSPKIPEFIRFPLNNYKVNVSYTSKMYPKGYRDMLVRKIKDNDFIVDIIEMHPDSEYVERKRLEKMEVKSDDLRLLMNNEDFTGYFLVYSKDNQLRYGERRENGVATTRLSF